MAPVSLDDRGFCTGQHELHPPEPRRSVGDYANRLLEAAGSLAQKRQAAGSKPQPGYRKLDAADAAPKLLARAVLHVALGERDPHHALGRCRTGHPRRPHRHPRPAESTSPRKR